MATRAQDPYNDVEGDSGLAHGLMLNTRRAFLVLKQVRIDIIIVTCAIPLHLVQAGNGVEFT